MKMPIKASVAAKWCDAALVKAREALSQAEDDHHRACEEQIDEIRDNGKFTLFGRRPVRREKAEQIFHGHPLDGGHNCGKYLPTYNIVEGRTATLSRIANLKVKLDAAGSRDVILDDQEIELLQWEMTP